MFTACGTIKRVVAFRLTNGTDLMSGLIDVCQKYALKDGVILSAFGSLESAVVKNVISISGEKYGAGYGAPTFLPGPIELLGSSGIICHDDDGNLLPHIHITLSDKDSCGFGGHLCEGTLVQNTVEGVIAEFEGINMRKIKDVERNMMVFSPE
jgi:predicted DNA-binding protein with PD1-like motif